MRQNHKNTKKHKHIQTQNNKNYHINIMGNNTEKQKEKIKNYHINIMGNNTEKNREKLKNAT